MRALFLIVMAFMVQLKLNAQLSKVHYVPPVAYSDIGNAIPDQGHYFYISTPSSTSVTVVITPVGAVSSTIQVSNSIPHKFEIDPPGGIHSSQIAIGASSSDVVSNTSSVVTNKGYIIEATAAVYVALRIASGAQAGALVSKGGAALGTDFRIGAFTNYKATSNYSSFLSVMATENTTSITINDIKDGVDIIDFDEIALGATAGMLNDISFTLNRGESYTIVTRSDQGGDVADAIEVETTQQRNSDGLIGAYVNSNKPVVVNSGSMNGSFGTGTSRDYGFDQLVDLSKIGTEYIFVKGIGSNDFENVLIVAHTDTTTITINGNNITNAKVHGKGANISGAYDPAAADLHIDAGDYYLIEGDFYTGGNMYVKSSAPVFAFQGIGAKLNDEANQGLFFVPPLKCSSVGDVDNIPNIKKIGDLVLNGSLNIISTIGASITISDDNNNNEPILTLNVASAGAGAFVVTGTNDRYETYKIINLEGNVKIVSNGELYCAYYNENNARASGAFYSGFSTPPDPPGATPGSSGNCLPNLNLQSGDMDLFTSFEWQYSAGSGFSTIVGTTNQGTYTPTIDGDYLIRGFISCPGEPTEFLDSNSLTVNFCPPTSTNEVSGVSTQTICATPSPTLNDLKKTASRPEGVDPGSDFSGVSYNLVWFSSATGTSTFLPATTILVDGSTYYVEAGSLSDPTAASYRQSLSRLKVIVDLVYGSYTLVPPSLNIIEGTTVATFSLVLNDEPSSSVIYDLVSSDISHLIVSTSSMTFTTLNWNVSQVGTLTTVDNLIADGLQSSNFTVRINDPLSDDCFFDPTPLPTYAIQIADDDVPAYTLSSVSGTLLEGNPQTATVSLVLLVAPLTDVIIDIASMDTTEVTLSQASLTFTAINWNVPQNITLSSVDEVIVDGSQTVSITANINATSNVAFTGLASQTVTVTNIDNDVPGFTVSPLLGTLTEGDSQTASLTVVLNKQPLSNIVVDLMISPTDEITTSVGSLTFTSSNWNTPQVITVSSVDEFLIDGTTVSTITFSINPTSDGAFTSLPNQFVLATNLDNDVAGFTVSSLGGGALQEGSLATVSFTLVLDAEPDSGFVILDIASLDLSEVVVNPPTTPRVFTPANWNVPQTVTLSSVDDIILDGTVISTINVSVNVLSTPAFSSLAVQTVLVPNLDNEVPGFQISSVIGTLTEGATSTASFKAVLLVQPLTDVQVNLVSNDISEVSLGGTTFLTFTAANWNVSQTITLNQVDEFLIDGSQTSSITASIDPSSNAGFIGLPSQSVVVTTLDNDVAGITIVVTDNLSSESGDTAQFTAQLDAIPTANVTIDFDTSNASEAVPLVTQVTFTPANWNIPQTVMILGIDDSPPVSDGSQPVNIRTFNVNSADSDFNALTDADVADVAISNQDNDAPGIVLSLLYNNFFASENGKSVIVQFELLSFPLGGEDVVVPLSLSGDVDEVSLSATSITIKAVNWDNPSANQITLTGIDDFLIDGTRAITLITGDPSSAEAPHNNLDADDVADLTLYNLDNDSPGLLITLPEIVSENASSTNFTVVLASDVSTPTTIKLIVNDSSELSVDVTELIFTSANWNIPQQVTVFGVDDPIIDGDIGSDIYLRIDPVKSDPIYASLTDYVVTVLNLDNDSDQDGDGVFDAVDNCIDTPNLNQEDLDLDGIGDVCDVDVDGDGVLNSEEIVDSTDQNDACSFMFQSITLPVLGTGDCDADGLINRIDVDDDNDGILDVDELFEDLDLDGIPNTFDLDSDGDGCFDTLEASFTDVDDNGLLGLGILEINLVGQVMNQGGYTPASDNNANGIPEYKEVNEVIRFETELQLITFFDGNRMSLSVELPFGSEVSYQWQINTGTEELPQWENVEGNIMYSGTQSSQMYIDNATESVIGKQYRVLANNLLFSCQETMVSTTKIVLADLEIPTAFSPDGDGFNDTWEIQGLNFKGGYELTVFNRWENIVFTTKNYQNDWAGTSTISSFISSSNQVPDGVYFYWITWADETAPVSGYVYIKRRKN